MPQAKYQIYYQKMIDDNRSVFDQFAKIHQQFEQNAEKAAEDFHQLGREVLDIIRDYDRRLCAAMGRGIYSVYSDKLSQKFWDLVREDFPKIDMVGVKIKKPTS
jgi:glucosamine 6-phosphate synthetase-like amidotransferase/phosphosugar isomerase protein